MKWGMDTLMGGTARGRDRIIKATSSICSSTHPPKTESKEKNMSVIARFVFSPLFAQMGQHWECVCGVRKANIQFIQLILGTSQRQSEETSNEMLASTSHIHIPIHV